jgi:hypothetical protein
MERPFREFLWSADSTLKETKMKILKGSRFVTYIVVVNFLCGILTGFVILPICKEQEYQFPLFFFRKYLKSVHYIWDFWYLLTFPITSFTIVNLANIVVYYMCHTKWQIVMYLDVIQHLNDGYENEDDDTLFHDFEYQKVFQGRFRCVLVRYKEILR